MFLIFKCSDHEIAEKIATDLPKLQRKAIVEVVFADAGGGQAFIVVTMGSGFAVVRAMRTEADGPNTLVQLVIVMFVIALHYAAHRLGLPPSVALLSGGALLAFLPGLPVITVTLLQTALGAGLSCSERYCE